MLAVLIVGARIHSPDARADSDVARRACGAQPGITIPLSLAWEEVAIEQPGVICAFRNKNGGFPTINVIEEPIKDSDIRPGVLGREAEIRNAYHLVGLTDASFSDSHIEPLGTVESFHTTARYMNRGIPMEVLVMQVQAADRTYTVSVVDDQEHPRIAKNDLISILRGIEIVGVTDQPSGAPDDGHHLYSWLSVLVIITIVGGSLLYFGARSPVKRGRRKKR